MKLKEKLHVIFSYLTALAMTLVFALFLSGRTGWFFFSVMALPPVISVVMTLIVRKYISFSADISESELYKGASAKLKITVKNNSFLPTPPIDLYLGSGSEMPCDIPEGICTVSVMPFSEYTVDISYTARIWGLAHAGTEKILLSDYASLFSFQLPSELAGFDVKIIPDIIDTASSGELLKSVNDAAASNDDSEETRENHALGFTGTAGFEHREYVPGDPVKRINWKLSGKRSKLLVRLDDEIIASRHTVILDSRNSSGSPERAEICGENMLGILSAMLRSGFSASVWYAVNGQWHSYEIDDEGAVEQLRLKLAGYRFVGSDTRLPLEQIASEGGKGCKSIILYTPCFDSELSSTVNLGKASSKTDISVTAAAASVSEGTSASGVWLLSHDGGAQCIM